MENKVANQHSCQECGFRYCDQRSEFLEFVITFKAALQLKPILCHNLNSWLCARPAGVYLRKGSIKIRFGGTSCVEAQ